MKSYTRKKEIRGFLLDRTFFIMLIIGSMFLVVIYHFYQIQIISHEVYAAKVIDNVRREVEIKAPRGLIYDRYGKPLVQNKAVNVICFDPEIKFAKEIDSNQILLNVAGLLEKEGCSYIDNMPISKNPPFVYTAHETQVQQFITNYVPYNNNEHKLELYKLSAEKLMEYLASEQVYNLADTFSESDKRKILAMRLQISQTQYQKYKKVTIAEDVNMKVVAAIEENQDDYPAITAEVDSQRYYIYGKALGNLIGYMRKITESQYETLQEKGYDVHDIIGQVGIEGEFESTLRGIDGSQLIEVDNVGRTVSIHPLKTKEAIPGNDLYLSIDVDFQVKVYNALEKRLSEGIIGRLKGVDKTIPLTGREVIVSMAKNNQIDLRQMSEAANGSQQAKLYHKIVSYYSQNCVAQEELDEEWDKKQPMYLDLKEPFVQMIEEEVSSISDTELLLVFGEQGTVAFNEVEMQSIREGDYELNSLLIQLLEEGRIKPDQMDITPCSGTAVVVDSNNGQTLALVSYPSYDSNDFTQNFNKIYTKLHDGIDNRSIEFNRALKTVKAPGSTFKMITGIAGLEEEVIGKNEMVYDSGQFTKAGDPPLKCWIYTNTGHGHGNEDMIGALEVSCNYYFNEVAYRLGEKYGGAYGGIKSLSYYAECFGLGEKSGIELEEAMPNISNPANTVCTQASRVLNALKTLEGEKKEGFYNVLLEYSDPGIGFYTLGNKEDTTIEGQIDYLSRPYIKKPMDIELSSVLKEDQNLNHILNRLLESYQEVLTEAVDTYAKELTQIVMTEDNDLSLKYRLKRTLNTFLKEQAGEKTIKAIKKMLNQIPQETMKQIYLQGYTDALSVNKDKQGKEDVCKAFKERIQAIENGSFDYSERLVNKILDRMINLYLDEYFHNVNMEWTTRDNISSAIGQGKHTFTPVQIARYMAGLANGKTVYNLTVLSGIYDHKVTQSYQEHQTSIFNTLNFKEENIEIVQEGMRAVVAGNHGTARNYFEDFEVEIAAKTGTAQENNCENSWITSFAPYNQPEIAVVSSMYGTDGLGSCTYAFVKDIYNLYFKVNEEIEKVSLDNQLAT